LKLQELAIQASLSLSPTQVELGEQYISLVLKWNKTRNLVSRNSSKKDLIEYFVDSAILSKHLQPGRIVDLGSGAGFPGLCLAVMNPHTEINLIDSNIKNIIWALILLYICDQLEQVELNLPLIWLHCNIERQNL